MNSKMNFVLSMGAILSLAGCASGGGAGGDSTHNGGTKRSSITPINTASEIITDSAVAKQDNSITVNLGPDSDGNPVSFTSNLKGEILSNITATAHNDLIKKSLLGDLDIEFNTLSHADADAAVTNARAASAAQAAAASAAVIENAKKSALTDSKTINDIKVGFLNGLLESKDNGILSFMRGLAYGDLTKEELDNLATGKQELADAAVAITPEKLKELELAKNKAQALKEELDNLATRKQELADAAAAITPEKLKELELAKNKAQALDAGTAYTEYLTTVYNPAAAALTELTDKYRDEYNADKANYVAAGYKSASEYYRATYVVDVNGEEKMYYYRPDYIAAYDAKLAAQTELNKIPKKGNDVTKANYIVALAAYNDANSLIAQAEAAEYRYNAANDIVNNGVNTFFGDATSALNALETALTYATADEKLAFMTEFAKMTGGVSEEESIADWEIFNVALTKLGSPLNAKQQSDLSSAFLAIGDKRKQILDNLKSTVENAALANTVIAAANAKAEEVLAAAAADALATAYKNASVKSVNDLIGEVKGRVVMGDADGETGMLKYSNFGYVALDTTPAYAQLAAAMGDGVLEYDQFSYGDKNNVVYDQDIKKLVDTNLTFNGNAVGGIRQAQVAKITDANGVSQDVAVIRSKNFDNGTATLTVDVSNRMNDVLAVNFDTLGLKFGHDSNVSDPKIVFKNGVNITGSLDGFELDGDGTGKFEEKFFGENRTPTEVVGGFRYDETKTEIVGAYGAVKK